MVADHSTVNIGVTPPCYCGQVAKFIIMNSLAPGGYPYGRNLLGTGVVVFINHQDTFT